MTNDVQFVQSSLKTIVLFSSSITMTLISNISIPSFISFLIDIISSIVVEFQHFHLLKQLKGLVNIRIIITTNVHSDGRQCMT